MCVYTNSAHNQTIHDIFYQNFHVPVAIQMLVCHRKVVHSYLLMRIYLRKDS